MIDINAMLNAAIKVAVDAHVGQLQQRLTDLAQRVENIAACYTHDVGQILTTLDELRKTGLSGDEMLQQLDNQEWFWDKLSKFVDKSVNNMNSIDLANKLDWETNVEAALENINLLQYLDTDKIVHAVIDDMEVTELAEKVKDELDVDDIVGKVKDDLDIDDIAERVKDELDYSNIVERVKDELDMSELASDVAAEMDTDEIVAAVREGLGRDWLREQLEGRLTVSIS